MSEAILYARMLKADRIDHYLTLLSIAHNPHAENPQGLFDRLNEERPGYLSYTGNSRDQLEPDRAGIARFKEKLARSKRGNFTPK